VKTRKAAREEATELVRQLMESSVGLARNDLEMAKEQAALARRVRLRFNIKLDPSLRRYICRGCKNLIVPGVNARVRLGHGKPAVIRITCSECGRVNRKILSRPYIRSGKVEKSDS
jgi:ribonuclease P protein subunit RPR2